MQEFATSLGLSVNEAKAVVSVLVIFAYVFVRWLVLRIVHRQVKDEEVWYRTRKIVTYVSFFLIVLTLVRIWVVPFGDLATYLGLVSAGVAVALADVLKNMVGWVYILSRRPFRVGDRIETHAFSGDVIDIRLFRFSILEIGNWVRGDHSTGRIVHVPNQIVFTGPIANYTEGFEFIWHEIPILVTFESDWKKAEKIIREIIGRVTPDVTGAALTELRKTAQAYRIKYGQMTPTVYVDVEDSGIQLTARMLVPVRSRRDVNQKVWRAVLDAFAAEPTIDLAYPTVRTYLQGPIRIDDHGSG